MSDPVTPAEPAVQTSVDEPVTPAETATDPAPAAPEVRDPAKLLSAYEAEKAKRREQDTALRDLRAEFDAMKAKADGTEAEFTKAQERAALEQAALAKANERILKAELRATAKGKLNDPTDIFRFPEIVDLSAFEVGADGEVDADALEAAVTSLIAKRPDLAAQSKRFQGTADGGARNDAAKPSQLTDADLTRMSAEQIDAARKEGRLNDLLGIKP